jgi:hypothetical protein
LTIADRETLTESLNLWRVGCRWQVALEVVGSRSFEIGEEWDKLLGDFSWTSPIENRFGKAHPPTLRYGFCIKGFRKGIESSSERSQLLVGEARYLQCLDRFVRPDYVKVMHGDTAIQVALNYSSINQNPF